MMKKSKKETKEWWKGLTENQRSQYISRVMEGKREKRRKRSIRLMSRRAGEFKCKECFHGQGGHCTDRLPNGCEYWFNPNSDKIGIGYPEYKNDTDRKKWLIDIKKKNPWLKVA